MMLFMNKARGQYMKTLKTMNENTSFINDVFELCIKYYAKYNTRIVYKYYISV